MIITNSDHSFEDIFDLGGDEFSEAIIEDGVENLLDSRLDADSVLIEDIKLETENGNFTINDLKTHNIKGFKLMPKMGQNFSIFFQLKVTRRLPRTP